MWRWNRFVFLACLLWASPGMAKAAPLAIQEIALTDGENSWSSKAQWAPGDRVFIRVIVSGLQRNAEKKVQVRESLGLWDHTGKVFLESPDLLKLEKEMPADPSSVELVIDFVIPEGLPAGAYGARILVEDAVASAKLQRDLLFNVAEAQSKGLEITRFSLTPTEDAQGLRGLSAKADAVLVGYQVDGAGFFRIEADLVLTDPTGKQGLKWDNILEKKEKSEPRGVPLKLSLTLELPENYAPGDYRLELKVRDRLSKREVVRSATWTKR